MIVIRGRLSYEETTNNFILILLILVLLPISITNNEVKAEDPNLSSPLKLTATNGIVFIELGIAEGGTPGWTGSYSLDGTSWTSYTPGTTGIIQLADGESVYFKGTYDSAPDSSKYLQFKMFTVPGVYIEASGNIMSLCSGDNFESAKTIPYAYMFYRLFADCYMLATAPTLPAETLTNSCYQYMFEKCYCLYQAPTLPATKLADSCYASMFSYCSYFKSAPVLPATELADSCYASMFSYCDYLESAPILPAEKLTNNCYNSMFSYCTRLEKPADLSHVTTLGNYCCYKMYSDCYNLKVCENKESGYEDKWITPNATAADNWSGDMLKNTNSSITTPEAKTTYYVKTEPNYLTFTANEDNSSIWFERANRFYSNVNYSLDGVHFEEYGNGQIIKLNKGEKVSFSGTNCKTDEYNHFNMEGSISASGDVTSITNWTGGDATLSDSCYSYMFEECDSLKTAPNLPSTKLAPNCYYKMFDRCTSLETTPNLPATELAQSCYCYMFADCINLTQAPELPATELADNCYMGMFGGCKSLTTAPELKATTLQDGCYWGMFKGCTSLTQAPELPSTTLADNCYSGMFYGCTNLTQAPKLPSTELADSCYSYMFFGCKNLTTAPNLPSTELADSCYSYMFYSCKNLTQAPALPATQLTKNCYNNMFYNCRGLTQAPKLPATELANGCYSYMFGGCDFTQAPALPATELADSCYACMFSFCYYLESAPVLPAEKLAKSCYSNMFSYCMSLTSAPALPATTLAPDCYSYMFSYCTSLTTAPKLPATTLADYCYTSMFERCSNLTQAPELPATTLSSNCYAHMFSECTSLTTAPTLPATILAPDCYSYMFSYCTNLVAPADLSHVTTLDEYCCYNMYYCCSDLKVYENDQTTGYEKEWKVVATKGTSFDSWNYDMFNSAGGPFTGNPVIGKSYYISGLNPITYTCDDDVLVIKDGNPHSISITVTEPTDATVQYSIDGGSTWTTGSSYTSSDYTQLTNIRFKVTKAGYKTELVDRKYEIAYPIIPTGTAPKFTGITGTISYPKGKASNCPIEINKDYVEGTTTASISKKVNDTLTPVASSNYTIASGSTIITLKDSYLNSLDVGTHTFKIDVSYSSTEKYTYYLVVTIKSTPTPYVPVNTCTK